MIKMIALQYITDRWFLVGQEYDVERTEYVELFCNVCTDPPTKQVMKHYVVTVDDVEYYVPEIVCAYFPTETASADMRGPDEKFSDEFTEDPVTDKYGKFDMVKATNEFLNIDLKAKDKRVFKGDVNQRRLRILNEAKEARGELYKNVGINEQEN